MLHRKRNKRLRIETLEKRRLLAVLTVTDATDTVADDGQLSLREAIFAANNNTIVDGVQGSIGHDEIRFAAELDGAVIQVTQGEITVQESLTVVGSGASNTIVRGNGSSRLIAINDTDGQGQ